MADARDLREAKLVRNVTATILLSVLLIYLVWGAFPNPRMNMQELGGLTPDQVVARLGSPHYDPRKLPHPWTPEREAKGEDGPLTLCYGDSDFFPWRWRGFGYAVVFENNQVVRVQVGSK